jgi:hypothetical protein
MHRFMVDFDTHFIDDDNRKGPILDPGIVTEPTGKFPAMLDCTASCRKF